MQNCVRAARAACKSYITIDVRYIACVMSTTMISIFAFLHCVDDCRPSNCGCRSWWKLLPIGTLLQELRTIVRLKKNIPFGDLL